MSEGPDAEVEIPFCFVTDYSFVKSKLKLTDAIRDLGAIFFCRVANFNALGIIEDSCLVLHTA